MKNKNLFVKIEGGKYKGKKLALPSLDTTRSTKSIVKNSFFDTVQFEILDKIFFEVFAGSGSMGLEAVSRGAKFSYFIEKDKEAFKTLSKNLSQIAPNSTKAYLGDSFKLYEEVIKEIEKRGEKAYIYIDPPFEIREGMEDIYDKTVELIAKTPADLVELIVLEHRSKVDFPQKIGEFTKTKTRKFGKTSLSYFKAE